jgi:hypothetical protein
MLAADSIATGTVVTPPVSKSQDIAGVLTVSCLVSTHRPAQVDFLVLRRLLGPLLFHCVLGGPRSLTAALTCT